MNNNVLTSQIIRINSMDINQIRHIIKCEIRQITGFIKIALLQLLHTHTKAYASSAKIMIANKNSSSLLWEKNKINDIN